MSLNVFRYNEETREIIGSIEKGIGSGEASSYQYDVFERRWKLTLHVR